MRTGITLRFQLLVVLLSITSCATRTAQAPRDRPEGYEQYRLPAACADTAAGRTRPLPTNYEDVQRSASLIRPDLVSRTAPPRVAFLWYFIREDGSTAEVRMWRSSGSREIDELALELGPRMRWRPPTCGGQPYAAWYGHPIAVGGAD